MRKKINISNSPSLHYAAKWKISKLNIIGSKDISTIDKDETPEIPRDNFQNPENYKSETVEVTEEGDDGNWYDRWRKDNL